VNLLLLGNSNESVQWFEGGETSEDIVRRRWSEEFGQPAEVTAKSIWPDVKFPATLEKWLVKYQPDIVYLKTVSFWFSHESVPLKLERIGGRLGKKLGKAGLDAASNRTLSHNVPFRLLRNLAQRTIGGDTNFSTADVIDCLSECIRIVLQREGTVLVVSGPGGRVNYAVTRRKQKRNEQRRQLVDQSLQSLCAQLHVEYEGAEEPQWRSPLWKRQHVGDGIHFNAAAAARRGDLMFESIRSARVMEQARYETTAP